MKRRVLPLAFIAALLLAFGAIAVACGGGGEPLALDEYFQRLAKVFADADERFEALTDQCAEDFESEEAEIEATRCFFDASVLVFRDALDETDDLDPPAEAEAAHEELVNAGADLAQFIGEFGEQLADTESASELEELFGEESFVDIGERYEEACLDLEEIARENDIDVDLDC